MLKTILIDTSNRGVSYVKYSNEKQLFCGSIPKRHINYHIVVCINKSINGVLDKRIGK